MATRVWQGFEPASVTGGAQGLAPVQDRIPGLSWAPCTAQGGDLREYQWCLEFGGPSVLCTLV